MATGGLYGNSSSGILSYFTWFIFTQSATAPATPVGGSWNFQSSVGTPPSGWVNAPVIPTTSVWMSLAVVSSQNASISWSSPVVWSSVSSVAGIVPIVNGGTNSSTAAGALANLGIITTPTGSLINPSGTTLQRDASPVFGYSRANSTTGQMEWWNGVSWVQMGGGATGGGADAVFALNSPSMTTSYSVPSGKNALMVGPMGVPTGVTLTLPTGSRLVVL